MSRMRTINQSIEYLKNKDSDTAVSAWWLRMMLKAGKLKHHRAGNKYLVDLDSLEDFLKNPPEVKDTDQSYGTLRKVY